MTRIGIGDVAPFVEGEFDGVHLDVVENQRVGDSLNNGPFATRTFIVEGIDAQDVTAKLPMAMRAPGIPKVGDGHPFLENLPCQTVEAEPVDGQPSIARVTATYGIQRGGGIIFPPEVGVATVEVAGTVTPMQTNFDRFGNPLALEYEVIIDEETGDTAFEREIATVEVQAPTATVVFRRREGSSPGQFSAQFVGFVNSRPVFGDERRTWMCTRIDGRSEDGGLTYNVTYEFQRSAKVELGPPKDDQNKSVLDGLRRRTQGWDEVLAYTLENGRIPTDVKVGVGLKLFEIAPEVDFWQIDGLPFGRRFYEPLGDRGVRP